MSQKKSEKPSVAFVLKGYPRLSETFIAQEIRNLEKLGLGIKIISLRHPTDTARHPIHSEIEADVSYLPEYLHEEKSRVLKAWLKARCLPGYSKAFRAFLKDYKRDKTRNRIRRFGQACVLATELPDSIERVHFHFLHTPASVTRYAAIMRKLPWSGSAHAKDIWTIPDWEKQEKMAEMGWLSTCTAYGAAHLRDLSPDPEKVHLIYHGLDLARFDHFDRKENDYDGSTAEKKVTLVSVGRLVKKKGYDDLLNALAKLPKDLHWKLIQVGGGTLEEKLKAQAKNLGLSDKIDWLGAQPQEKVLEEIRKADAFVLASKVVEDGDRDGLPNVLMEAQSQGLAVVSTNISAIPELIVDGKNGLLAEAEDADNLSEKLLKIITVSKQRFKMGQAGEKRVREEFDADHCITRLAECFNLDHTSLK
ncbi:glycosyltransferase family 4 protein [Curvivirga aplysinae]|uniref:glycosyltransferase family 4 protein n=1 Tax=Curvivirga aplysinae TaxID=2529852 RepID=UPI0012BCE2F7|nr:glycosyltransferase family 4 protein [Curvivirga aplysinae]MTI09333.1 colanic acid biosynthesis glycosyltransferase WcaL [Curvivirga aplysinae]